jgi:hypothetical protein|tara:strand:- start:1423 stop:1608 length:186 start_codon:yes stop_codon:yes gene_type:complete
MKDFELIRGQEFTDGAGRVMTIRNVTNENYPVQKVNGAWVSVDGHRDEWLNIYAIYNFKEN